MRNHNQPIFNSQRTPVFNVPTSVVALLSVMVAIHVIRQLLPAQTDNLFVTIMAFIPARYGSQFFNGYIPGGETAAFTSPITHMFIHGDVLHLLYNCAWLLGCGGAIAMRVGTVRFLAFTAVTGIAGAAMFLMFNFGLPIPVVGASGAISGMMAGLLRFIFSAVDTGDIAALRHSPHTVRLIPLVAALHDKRILLVIALWMAFNAFPALGFGSAQDAGAIAWEAHLGGFLAGFFLFGLFDFREHKPRLKLL